MITCNKPGEKKMPRKNQQQQREYQKKPRADKKDMPARRLAHK